MSDVYHTVINLLRALDRCPLVVPVSAGNSGRNGMPSNVKPKENKTSGKDSIASKPSNPAPYSPPSNSGGSSSGGSSSSSGSSSKKKKDSGSSSSSSSSSAAAAAAAEAARKAAAEAARKEAERKARIAEQNARAKEVADATAKANAERALQAQRAAAEQAARLQEQQARIAANQQQVAKQQAEAALQAQKAAAAKAAAAAEAERKRKQEQAAAQAAKSGMNGMPSNVTQHVTNFESGKDTTASTSKSETAGNYSPTGTSTAGNYSPSGKTATHYTGNAGTGGYYSAQQAKVMAGIEDSNGKRLVINYQDYEMYEQALLNIIRNMGLDNINSQPHDDDFMKRLQEAEKRAYKIAFGDRTVLPKEVQDAMYQTSEDLKAAAAAIAARKASMNESYSTQKGLTSNVQLARANTKLNYVKDAIKLPPPEKFWYWQDGVDATGLDVYQLRAQCVDHNCSVDDYVANRALLDAHPGWNLNELKYFSFTTMNADTAGKLLANSLDYVQICVVPGDDGQHTMSSGHLAIGQEFLGTDYTGVAYMNIVTGEIIRIKNSADKPEWYKQQERKAQANEALATYYTNKGERLSNQAHELIKYTDIEDAFIRAMKNNGRSASEIEKLMDVPKQLYEWTEDEYNTLLQQANEAFAKAQEFDAARIAAEDAVKAEKAHYASDSWQTHEQEVYTNMIEYSAQIDSAARALEDSMNTISESDSIADIVRGMIARDKANSVTSVSDVFSPKARIARAIDNVEWLAKSFGEYWRNSALGGISTVHQQLKADKEEYYGLRNELFKAGRIEDAVAVKYNSKFWNYAIAYVATPLLKSLSEDLDAVLNATTKPIILGDQAYQNYNVLTDNAYTRYLREQCGSNPTNWEVTKATWRYLNNADGQGHGGYIDSYQDAMSRGQQALYTEGQAMMVDLVIDLLIDPLNWVSFGADSAASSLTDALAKNTDDVIKKVAADFGMKVSDDEAKAIIDAVRKGAKRTIKEQGLEGAVDQITKIVRESMDSKLVSTLADVAGDAAAHESKLILKEAASTVADGVKWDGKFADAVNDALNLSMRDLRAANTAEARAFKTASTVVDLNRNLDQMQAVITKLNFAGVIYPVKALGKTIKYTREVIKSGDFMTATLLNSTFCKILANFKPAKSSSEITALIKNLDDELKLLPKEESLAEQIVEDLVEDSYNCIVHDFQERLEGVFKAEREFISGVPTTSDEFVNTVLKNYDNAELLSLADELEAAIRDCPVDKYKKQLNDMRNRVIKQAAERDGRIIDLVTKEVEKVKRASSQITNFFEHEDKISQKYGVYLTGYDEAGNAITKAIKEGDAVPDGAKLQYTYTKDDYYIKGWSYTDKQKAGTDVQKMFDDQLKDSDMLNAEECFDYYNRTTELLKTRIEEGRAFGHKPELSTAAQTQRDRAIADVKDIMDSFKHLSTTLETMNKQLSEGVRRADITEQLHNARKEIDYVMKFVNAKSKGIKNMLDAAPNTGMSSEAKQLTRAIDRAGDLTSQSFRELKSTLNHVSTAVNTEELVQARTLVDKLEAMRAHINKQSRRVGNKWSTKSHPETNKAWGAYREALMRGATKDELDACRSRILAAQDLDKATNSKDRVKAIAERLKESGVVQGSVYGRMTIGDTTYDVIYTGKGDKFILADPALSGEIKNWSYSDLWERYGKYYGPNTSDPSVQERYAKELMDNPNEYALFGSERFMTFEPTVKLVPVEGDEVVWRYIDQYNKIMDNYRAMYNDTLDSLRESVKSLGWEKAGFQSRETIEAYNTYQLMREAAKNATRQLDAVENKIFSKLQPLNKTLTEASKSFTNLALVTNIMESKVTNLHVWEDLEYLSKAYDDIRQAWNIELVGYGGKTQSKAHTNFFSAFSRTAADPKGEKKVMLDSTYVLCQKLKNGYMPTMDALIATLTEARQDVFNRLVGYTPLDSFHLYDNKLLQQVGPVKRATISDFTAAVTSQLGLNNGDDARTIVNKVLTEHADDIDFDSAQTVYRFASTPTCANTALLKLDDTKELINLLKTGTSKLVDGTFDFDAFKNTDAYHTVVEMAVTQRVYQALDTGCVPEVARLTKDAITENRWFINRELRDSKNSMTEYALDKITRKLVDDVQLQHNYGIRNLDLRGMNPGDATRYCNSPDVVENVARMRNLYETDELYKEYIADGILPIFFSTNCGKNGMGNPSAYAFSTPGYGDTHMFRRVTEMPANAHYTYYGMDEQTFKDTYSALANKYTFSDVNDADFARQMYDYVDGAVKYARDNGLQVKFVGYNNSSAFTDQNKVLRNFFTEQGVPYSFSGFLDMGDVRRAKAGAQILCDADVQGIRQGVQEMIREFAQYDGRSGVLPKCGVSAANVKKFSEQYHGLYTAFMNIEHSVRATMGMKSGDLGHLMFDKDALVDMMMSLSPSGKAGKFNIRQVMDMVDESGMAGVKKVYDRELFASWGIKTENFKRALINSPYALKGEEKFAPAVFHDIADVYNTVERLDREYQKLKMADRLVHGIPQDELRAAKNFFDSWVSTGIPYKMQDKARVLAEAIDNAVKTNDYGKFLSIINSMKSIIGQAPEMNSTFWYNVRCLFGDAVQIPFAERSYILKQIECDTDIKNLRRLTLDDAMSTCKLADKRRVDQKLFDVYSAQDLRVQTLYNDARDILDKTKDVFFKDVPEVTDDMLDDPVLVARAQEKLGQAYRALEKDTSFRKNAIRQAIQTMDADEQAQYILRNANNCLVVQGKELNIKESELIKHYVTDSGAHVYYVDWQKDVAKTGAWLQGDAVRISDDLESKSVLFNQMRTLSHKAMDDTFAWSNGHRITQDDVYRIWDSVQLPAGARFDVPAFKESYHEMYNCMVIGTDKFTKLYDPHAGRTLLEGMASGIRTIDEHCQKANDLLLCATSERNSLKYAMEHYQVGDLKSTIKELDKENMKLYFFDKKGFPIECTRLEWAKQNADRVFVLDQSSVSQIRDFSRGVIRNNRMDSSALWAGVYWAGDVYSTTIRNLRIMGMLFSNLLPASGIRNAYDASRKAIAQAGSADIIPYLMRGPQMDKAYSEITAMILDSGSTLDKRGIETFFETCGDKLPLDKQAYLTLHALEGDGIVGLADELTKTLLNQNTRLYKEFEGKYSKDFVDKCVKKFAHDDNVAWLKFGHKDINRLEYVQKLTADELEVYGKYIHQGFRPALNEAILNKGVLNPFKLGRKVFDGVEGSTRKALAMYFADRGESVASIAKKITESQFNYADFSKGVNFIAPFSAFKWYNIKFWADTAMANPRFTSFAIKRARAGGYLYGDEEYAELIQWQVQRDRYLNDPYTYDSYTDDELTEWLDTYKQRIETYDGSSFLDNHGLPFGNHHFIKDGDSFATMFDWIGDILEMCDSIGTDNVYEGLGDVIYDPYANLLGMLMTGNLGFQKNGVFTFEEARTLASFIPFVDSLWNAIYRDTRNGYLNVKTLAAIGDDSVWAVREAKGKWYEYLLDSIPGMPALIGTRKIPRGDLPTEYKALASWQMKGDPSTYFDWYGMCTKAGMSRETALDFLNKLWNVKKIDALQYNSEALGDTIMYLLNRGYDPDQVLKMLGNRADVRWISEASPSGLTAAEFKNRMQLILYNYNYAQLPDYLKYGDYADVLAWYEEQGYSKMEARTLMNKQHPYIDPEGNIQFMSDYDYAAYLRREDDAYAKYMALLPKCAIYDVGCNVYKAVSELRKWRHWNAEEALRYIVNNNVFWDNTRGGLRRFTPSEITALNERNDKEFHEWWDPLPNFIKYTKGLYSKTVDWMKKIGISTELSRELMKMGIYYDGMQQHFKLCDTYSDNGVKQKKQWEKRQRRPWINYGKRKWRKWHHWGGRRWRRWKKWKRRNWVTWGPKPKVKKTRKTKWRPKRLFPQHCYAHNVYRLDIRKFRRMKPQTMKSAATMSLPAVGGNRRNAYNQQYAKYGLSRITMRSGLWRGQNSASTTRLRRNIIQNTGSAQYYRHW